MLTLLYMFTKLSMVHRLKHLTFSIFLSKEIDYLMVVILHDMYTC